MTAQQSQKIVRAYQIMLIHVQNYEDDCYTLSALMKLLQFHESPNPPNTTPEIATICTQNVDAVKRRIVSGRFIDRN